MAFGEKHISTNFERPLWDVKGNRCHRAYYWTCHESFPFRGSPKARSSLASLHCGYACLILIHSLQRMCERYFLSHATAVMTSGSILGLAWPYHLVRRKILRCASQPKIAPSCQSALRVGSSYINPMRLSFREPCWNAWPGVCVDRCLVHLVHEVPRIDDLKHAAD